MIIDDVSAALNRFQDAALADPETYRISKGDGYRQVQMAIGSLWNKVKQPRCSEAVCRLLLLSDEDYLYFAPDELCTYAASRSSLAGLWWLESLIAVLSDDHDYGLVYDAGMPRLKWDVCPLTNIERVGEALRVYENRQVLLVR